MQHDFELCIQKVPRCLSKQACIWLRQSAVTRYHLLKKKKKKTVGRIQSSFISSICFNIRTFAFLLLLGRVDISDFPQSLLAKLQ